MPGLSAAPAPGMWRDLVVLHRLEHPLPAMYLCYSGWGACYAAGATHGLTHLPVLLAVAANLLLMVGGLALNNAVDVPTDRQHREKVYLSGAALRIGRQRSLLLAGIEMGSGAALSIMVSLVTDRWQVTAVALAITLLHLLYNVEPVRLKRRGLAGSAAFGLSVVTLPSLLSYYALGGSVPGWTLAVFAGAGVLATGRTVWWSAPDRAADLRSGIGTPVARYGVPRTLAVSCLIMLAGLLLLGSGLWLHYGFVVALIAAAAHVVFAGCAVIQLRAATRGTAPSASAMRTHALPLVLTGELAIALVPLVAP